MSIVIHANVLQIKCDYNYFSQFHNSIKASKLVAQKGPHKAFQRNFISLKTYSRVSMGLTDKRKTAQNLFDSRKN